MIEIRQVSKSYGDDPVLKDITADIASGGVTSIIGPNGAGKSTLLSVISRLLPADSGRVEVNGLDVSTTPGDQLATTLSVLRQENQYASRLTVEELVGFGRYPYSRGRLTKDDRARIAAALEFLNLSALRHRFLDELSGGQRQRTYVAMVLCQDTEYVLLDEPLNNLDMKHAVSMMQQLRRAADELGKTIVLVIHDINFASVYSDYIIAMKAGQIRYKGKPAEIITSAILEDIFETPVMIECLGRQRIAVYYR